MSFRRERPRRKEWPKNQMGRKRLYEIAKETGKDNTTIFELAKKLGFAVKTHSSTLEEEEASKIRKILLGIEPLPEEKKERPSTILRKAAKPPPVVEEPPPPVAPPPPPSAIPVTAEPVAPPPPVEAPKEPPPVKEPSPPLPPDSVNPSLPVIQAPLQEPAAVKAVPTARPLPIAGPQEKKKKKKGIRPPPEIQLLQKKVVTKEIPEPPADHPDYKLFDYYDTASLYPQVPQRRKKKIIPKKEHKKSETAPIKPEKKVLRIHDGITVGMLSQRIGVKIATVISRLIDLGEMVTANQIIDPDKADLIAKEFGYEVEKVSIQPQSLLTRTPSSPELLHPRPPVVTVMGHVDHGKTTLLDAIRQTKVAESESGGITQHIGASSVEFKGKRIVFLDTPGHEAFTAMRARGARATDIVILVVAADDGVMPQTLEALSHARAAQVPIIVAINKIDKPEARPQQVMTQLSDKGLIPEKWGGDTLYGLISAKQKKGIEEILDHILLQAEVLDLKADPQKPATGTVIEARLDRGRGSVATLLVKEGTLKVGDPIVVGQFGGKVRAMIDEKGNRITKATPSTPVEVIGLSGVPNAGETFSVTKDEEIMRQFIKLEEVKTKASAASVQGKVTLEDVYKQMEEGSNKYLNIVLKTDVVGSAEAIQEALKKLHTDTIKLSVVHSGVGGITANDVMLASASKAIVIGFNVRPDSKASEIAERDKVEIRTYNIIYELISDIQKAMVGLLEPTFKEKVVGRAVVKEIFNISKVGTIAGSLISEGKVVRGMSARILRDSSIVYTSRISSLRRFKDDVKEVLNGLECGIGIENFNDIKKGDTIETFEMEKIAPKLEQKP